MPVGQVLKRGAGGRFNLYVEEMKKYASPRKRLSTQSMVSIYQSVPEALVVSSPTDVLRCLL